MGNKSLIFVSGVSGAGKTAVMPYLKSLFPTNFEIHDFDEDGVPAGADHVWRINKTTEWINFGSKKSDEGITVIVCGIANPDEIAPLMKDFPNLEIKMILLDGEVEKIEQRLRSRNKNPKIKSDLERVVGSTEIFIKNNSNFLPILREIYKKYNYPIIDTTHIDSIVVAERLAELIK